MGKTPEKLETINLATNVSSIELGTEIAQSTRIFSGQIIQMADFAVAQVFRKIPSDKGDAVEKTERFADTPEGPPELSRVFSDRLYRVMDYLEENAAASDGWLSDGHELDSISDLMIATGCRSANRRDSMLSLLRQMNKDGLVDMSYIKTPRIAVSLANLRLTYYGQEYKTAMEEKWPEKVFEFHSRRQIASMIDEIAKMKRELRITTQDLIVVDEEMDPHERIDHLSSLMDFLEKKINIKVAEEKKKKEEQKRQAA